MTRFARIRVYDPSDQYVELWLNLECGENIVEAAMIASAFCHGVGAAGRIYARVCDISNFAGNTAEVFRISDSNALTDHINRYLGAPRA